MKRAALIYISVLSLAILPILWLMRAGSALPLPGGGAQQTAVTTGAGASPLQNLAAGVGENLGEPLSHLFLQLLAIIVVSRLVGRVFVAIGQPAVVGEMTAGILLGPSLFGLLAPGPFAFVFPAKALGSLNLFSQIGVCLFMFTVGMELNVAHIKKQAQRAILVSHSSIVVPFFLGITLAYFLYGSLAAPGASFVGFALFIGISMSITAFPVLARILQERGISRTQLGATAITCAAVDDVTAWSILAFIVAIARASSVSGCALNLLLVAAFIGLMIGVVKPILHRWLAGERIAEEAPSKMTLAVVACVVVASALCTQAIGIHALFGAFLAGAIMPDANEFRHKLSVRVEDFSSVLLLPLFFAFTGLRTQIGLLNDAQSWLICLAITATATFGKLAGSAIPARLTGMDWRDSLQLGALMNTRGLMELIALNIGYDFGILPPRIFTMLVIMALITTMLTGPLLTLFGKKQPALNDTGLPSPV